MKCPDHFIIFKIYIISMKKIQKENSKEKNHKKKDYYNLLSPNKKQFQLFYRERDAEPSPECFQSIIFVKSKKVNNKEVPSKRKIQQKTKKNEIQQLKQMMTQLQKKVNSEHKKTYRIQEENMKNITFKSTCSTSGNFFSNKKIRESSSMKNIKKQNVFSLDNVKKYKNMLSPTKSIINNKENPYKKANTQILKKEKSNKKINLKSLQRQQNEEYVFLQNNFMQINEQQANILHDKINLNQKNRKSNKNLINKVSAVSSAKDSQSLSYAYNVNQYIQVGQTIEQRQFIQEEPSIIDPIVIEKFIQCKIKTIQRWWKKMIIKLREERKKNNLLKKIDEKMRKYQFSQNSQNELDKSYLFKHDQFEDNVQISPIKLIEEQVDEKSKNMAMNAIELRQMTVKKHCEIYLQLLQELLKKNQISQLVYREKKSIIEAKCYVQLNQISQIRKIIKKNGEKVIQMQEKLKADVLKVQKNSNDFDLNALDQIFGKDFSKDVLSTQNKTENIVNRQKSTGCHFNYQQKAKVSMYQKVIETKQEQQQENDQRNSENNEEGQQYEQDFQEQDSQNNENSQQEAVQGSVHPIVDKNYQAFLQECKFRQQLKQELDKRVAIQMGMLIQILPDQIRQNYTGIDTSLNNIHKFLVSFFKYYIFYYKDDFLRLINMPFGNHVKKRLRNIQGNGMEDSESQESCDDEGILYGIQNVIREEVLQEFYDKIYDGGQYNLSDKEKAVLSFEKAHNKAIFDCFNACLNSFRPYYVINGAPYPWTCSEKSLTFYYIAEENIQEVFEKTQFKVLKHGSSLCGILFNKFSLSSEQIKKDAQLQQIEQFYLKSNHPCLNETRQDRLIKNERIDIVQTYHEWQFFDEENTLVQFETVEEIYNQILLEVVLDLASLFNTSDYKNNKMNQQNHFSAFLT